MRQLFKRLFARAPEADAAETLLAATTAQARSPWFHTQGGVPDTLDGRFDVLTLHAVLLLDALGKRGPQGARTAQFFGNQLFDSLDETIREIGVGDMGVARRMKAMAAAFYGRAEAYRAALGESGDAALVEALKRNLYRGAEVEAAAAASVAAYVRGTASRLAATPAAELLGGRPQFAEAGRP